MINIIFILISVKIFLMKTRTLAVVEPYPKVKEFLNSVGRNSEQTKKVYTFALAHFETFLLTQGYNLETLLTALGNKKLSVYSILDRFVGYLYDRDTRLSSSAIILYLAAVRSYLERYDIDIVPNKFKRQVKLPKNYKRIKEPLDAKDIRAILQACNNSRLKAFLLVISSSGLRAREATTLRNCDIDFSQSPTKIHILAENTKTRQERTVYISTEATNELKQFIDSKYGNQHDYMEHPNDLVFSLHNKEVNPKYTYNTLNKHFHNILRKINRDKRKAGQTIRREISFHSMRTFVKSVIGTQTNSDFSEQYLGHSYSTYWNIKESERRELYLKCLPYLTFLDYPTVENIGKSYENKLQERDKELSNLRQMIYNYQKAEEINEKRFEQSKKDTLKTIASLLEETKDVRSELGELRNTIAILQKNNPKTVLN
jgi:integrase